MIPYISIFLAIYLGGEPIRSFFMKFGQSKGLFFFLCSLLFSMSVVASSFIFCALSDNQFTSQLFMLISTVCCGVFLKLYLDRNKYFPFNIVSQYFLFISPSFTFSTAMFYIFKEYQNSVILSLSEENFVSGGLEYNINTVVFYLTIMACQSLIYLVGCITVDVFYVRVCSLYLKLKWYYSSLSTSMVEHDSSIFCNNENNNVDYSSCLTETTVLYGQGITRLLNSNNCIGIFPTINSAIYQEALNSKNSYKQTKNSIDNLSVNECLQNSIELKKLCVAYSNKSSKLALCNLTFYCEKSGRIALMGMNGSGKSTLFKTLTLAENVPLSGTAVIDGYDSILDTWKMGPRKVSGYVPQDGGLMTFLTVKETIDIFTQINLRGEDEDGKKYYYDNFKIIDDKYLDYPVHALSGGTKKKLLIQLANIGTHSIINKFLSILYLKLNR
jgi:ABC-type lipoprotein export system ATPase subunit